MKEVDLQVKTALTNAGYGAWPASSRGELFESLTQIRKQHPLVSEDFIDQQRRHLEEADHQEAITELELLRARYQFIKACPECGHKPDFGPGYATAKGDALVVCMNHSAGAVTRSGESVSVALERWNADDWLAPGPDRQRYPL